jgi:hypothetical protein
MDARTKQSLQQTGFFFLSRNSESIDLNLEEFWKIVGNQVFHCYERKQLESWLDPNTTKTKFSHCEVFSEEIHPSSRYQFGSFVLLKCDTECDFAIFDSEKEIK